MRLSILIAAVMLLGACRTMYMADIADLATTPDELPEPGISRSALTTWFDDRGYIPGPRVFQAESELRRRPGDPLVYAQPGDRVWWSTAYRTVQHACVTKRVIYYRVAADGQLSRAIRSHRNQC